VNGHFLILKGHSLKKGQRYGQFHDLARKLAERKDYYGKEFSWGDSYILDCANRQVTSGNLSTWRAVGTSHHVTVIARSILMRNAS